MHTDWNVTPKQAVELQKKLRGEVLIQPLSKTHVGPIKTIGGCDVSMSMFAEEGFAGFVVLDVPGLHPVDHAVQKGTIPFPYVPGLLSFREIPMLLAAWKKLRQKPDVLIADGVGIAHPRRLGIASHLGLVLGIPTIGCAKSVLVGTYEEPDNEPGSHSYMYDKGEIVGAAVRTKRNVKPVFVSPGHLITLDESVETVQACVLRHRLPEPTRLAHNVVNEYRLADS